MKKTLPKRHKISFTLPAREGELLKSYAKEHRVSRPVAVRRMVKAALKEYAQKRPAEEPRNQLGLFDVVQIDIFNSTTKVNDK